LYAKQLAERLASLPPASCAAGEGFTAGDAVKDASCTVCAAGSWNNVDGTTSCAAKTVLKCAYGKGFTEGTTTADDASCANCIAGEYSDSDDTAACKAKTLTTCPSGQGYTEGAATADSSTCDACTRGKFSNADDAHGCQNHSTPICPAGKGVKAGTSTVDAFCVPCTSGTYSTDTDSSACTEHTCADGTYLASAANEAQACAFTCVLGKYTNAGGCQDCTSGQYSTSTDVVSCMGIACATGKYGPAASRSSENATCATCGAGKFADQTGQTVCTPHSTAKCGTGLGYTFGSPAADDALCTVCAARTFSAADDARPCATWTIVMCPIGQGFLTGSASSDASCTPCATGTFSAKEDTGTCQRLPVSPSPASTVPPLSHPSHPSPSITGTSSSTSGESAKEDKKKTGGGGLSGTPDLPYWAWACVGVGGLSVLVCAVVCLVCCCRRRSRVQKPAGDGWTKQTEMAARKSEWGTNPIYNVADHKSAREVSTVKNEYA
jgi:hypothetical protein